MQDSYEQYTENIDKDMDMQHPSAGEDAQHKMRLSIDIRSIKDANFKGYIYAKYYANPTLGIKQFATLPAIQVTKLHEEKFNNAFQSYEFVSSKSNLYPALAETNLEIEIYHQEKHEKDRLVGLARIDVNNLLTCPIRKTVQSYARIYNAYHSVDEIDENRQLGDRVALLHVIIYLEDLGPTSMIKAHEQKVEEKYREEINSEIPVIPASIALRQTKDATDDNNLMNEISSLEYKIIWELETWKKAEEAKFKYQLKTKEIEYFTKLNEDWRKKELEREKLYKASEAKIQTLESRLKQKANDLQKREQKLVMLEEELKQRINETARQINVKEDEINTIKRKTKEEKLQLEKDKNILMARCENQEALIKRLEQEYSSFKKEQENSPVNIIRTELSAKNLEINSLKQELDKSNQIKEQYRTHYEKLRDEIIRIKKSNEAVREDMQRQYQTEIEHLKIRLNSMTMMEDKENLASLRNDLNTLKGKTLEETTSATSSSKNPFTKNLLQNQNTQTKTITKSTTVTSNTNSIQTRQRTEPTSEMDRLISKRDELLDSGLYDENDPLIQEFNQQIARL